MRNVVIAALLAATAGCETVVDVDVETRPAELVVTSFFTPDEPWRVLVQRTVGTQEVTAFPAVVENATVTIRGDDGSFVALSHKGGGFYHAGNSFPRAGVTYTLHAAADGFRTVEAVDRLPAPAVVTAVRVQARSEADHGTKRIDIEIRDDGEVRNFYELSVLHDKQVYQVPFTLLNAELEDQIRSLDPGDLFEPELTTPYVYRALIHDDPFDGKTFAFRLETDGFHLIQSNATIYIRTVSEAYFLYQRTRLLQQAAERNPFVEPIMVQSNIRNGQGVFAGYSLHTHGALSPRRLRSMASGAWKAFEFAGIEDNEPVNYLADGGSVAITLRPDFTVVGRMQLPSLDGALLTITLDGGFSLQGRDIRLFHSTDTVLRDMNLQFDPNSNSLSGHIGNPGHDSYIRFAQQ